MGLMDKFKNLFTEEVEEEVKPIKKEVRHVEIPSPRREIKEVKVEKPTEDISDRSIIKEEKVSFPLYFDDKDFDDLEKPKKELKTVKKETPKSEAYQGAKVQKVERKFEASPIISPVYGVLDKNYKKEDIPTRKEQPSDYTRKPRSVTVDDIRNKAFGTLEDDLEDTLFGNKSILFHDEEPIERKVEEPEIDIFEGLQLEETTKSSIEENSLKEEILKDTSSTTVDSLDDDMDEDTIILAKQLEEQKKKLEQINEYINESSVEESKSETLEDDFSEDILEEKITDLNEIKHAEENIVEEEKTEDLTESELLNLVDAMYEKRDED